MKWERVFEPREGNLLEKNRQEICEALGRVIYLVPRWAVYEESDSIQGETKSKRTKMDGKRLEVETGYLKYEGISPKTLRERAHAVEVTDMVILFS